MNEEKTHFQKVQEICKKDYKTWTPNEHSKVYLWFFGPDGMEFAEEVTLRRLLVRHRGFNDVQWAKLLISNFPTEENVEYIINMHYPNKQRGLSVAHKALRKLFNSLNQDKQKSIPEVVLRLIIAKGSKKISTRASKKLQS